MLRIFLSLFILFSSVLHAQEVEEIEWQPPADELAAAELLPEGSDNSILYKTIREPIIASKKFVLRIFGELEEITRPLFISLATLYLLFTFARWKIQKKADILQVGVALCGMMFASELVKSPETFDSWVYKPVVETTEAFAGFMITTAAGTTAAGGDDALKDTLQTIQSEIAKIYTIKNYYSEVADGYGITQIGSALKSLFASLVILIIYSGLAAVFCFLYMIGFVAIHFMLVLSPFIILIGSVPFMRGFLKNWAKTILTFALMPIFASIAMGLTVFIIGDYSNEALQATKALKAGTAQDLPQGLYFKVVLVGLMSIYMHLKSSEFSSHLTGGPLTNFGQAAGAAVAAGAGASKAYAVAPAAGVAKGGAGYVGGVIAHQTGASGASQRMIQKLQSLRGR